VKRIIPLVYLMAYPFSQAYAEYGVELQPNQLTTVRMHTIHHSNANARQMALVKIAGLNDNCNSGVFFDATQNKETLSFVLSAFVAKTNVRLGYEPSIRAPWGDTNYCALTYFDVK